MGLNILILVTTKTIGYLQPLEEQTCYMKRNILGCKQFFDGTDFVQ